MRGVKQAVVYHLKWNASLDQRVVHPKGCVFDFLVGGFAAPKPSRLLGIEHANSRQRSFIAQILFAAMMPAIEVLDSLEPAGVVQHPGKFREPGTQVIGNAFYGPNAN